jgi:hypothetical protein
MLCASIAEIGIKRKELCTTKYHKTSYFEVFPAILLISLDADRSGEID